jgi:hypothetical protein
MLQVGGSVLKDLDGAFRDWDSSPKRSALPIANRRGGAVPQSAGQCDWAKLSHCFKIYFPSIDAGFERAHYEGMLKGLRSHLPSRVIRGIFACVIAMLVAMPVLRATAEARSCHKPQVVSAIASNDTHNHEAGHQHFTAVVGHDEDASNSVAAHIHPNAEDDNPEGKMSNHHKSSQQSSCCLPGCGFAILEAAVSLGGAETLTTLDLLPFTALVDGLDPSAPRKPPRTTYIVDLAA